MSFLSYKQLLGNEHRLLGLMMITLLAALYFINDINISRSLFITHFGFFLMWQPVLKQEQDFSLVDLVILVGPIGLFIIWLNLWLTPFWMLLLLSLLTGRIFSQGMGRVAYSIAVIVLFLELILITTPALFNLYTFSTPTIAGLRLALILSLVPLFFIHAETRFTVHVDFIRGFLIVLLTLFLCMGSVLVTFTTDIPYLQALASTIIIAALFLMTTSILWSPRGGFSGLAQLWEKYLLNIGGPFEQWISQLSSLEANTSLEPDYFLKTSISHLEERHWISGIYWKTEKSEGLVGEKTRHLVSVNDNKVSVTLYAYSPIGPALLLHTKLLLSVLTFYYRAKVQERQLTKQAHLRAIYETGSKLTHDVKNILQSTKTLTQAILQEDSRSEETFNILKKQLPLLTQRLQSTLEKLSAPTVDTSETMSLVSWWQDIQSKYAGRNVMFSESIHADHEIPVEVFNTVTENLLDNARTKRILDHELVITITLQADDKHINLRVMDNGKPVPDEVKELLFNEVIFSENGFGIGLYQSSQLAKKAGYELKLESNNQGNVCFSLSRT